MTEFFPMHEINTTAAISSDITIEQMKKNIKRGLPRLHNIDGFRLSKDEPIAIVGGGPSLKDNLEKLREFKVKIACGSAHDYLVENDIYCTYAVVCDPDAIAANYLKAPVHNTKYLVSTGCDDKVYEALKFYDIYLWHCYSDDALKRQAEIEPNFQAVGGGCTVGLRSISIALMLGYSDIHFFGFDSCLRVSDRAHHAYNFSDTTQEQLGEIYEVCLGTKDKMNKDKVFHCAGYQLAQASHFKDFYARYHSVFTPTFHGEGLLTELMSIINKEKQKLKSVEQKPHREALKGLLETAETGITI